MAKIIIVDYSLEILIRIITVYIVTIIPLFEASEYHIFR